MLLFIFCVVRSTKCRFVPCWPFPCHGLPNRSFLVQLEMEARRDPDQILQLFLSHKWENRQDSIEYQNTHPNSKRFEKQTVVKSMLDTPSNDLSLEYHGYIVHKRSACKHLRISAQVWQRKEVIKCQRIFLSPGGALAVQEDLARVS